MARTKTLFKSHFSSEEFKNMSQEMKQINAFLSEDNSSLMFVTGIACILDLTTGAVEYVDAGHEPPLILRKNGEIEILKKKGGMALCFDPEFDYQPGSFKLNPGDGIVLYTDGLEDAKNEQDIRHTLEGALEILRPIASTGSPKDINDTLLAKTKEFIGKANQFDDITVVTLRYIGK